MKKFLIIIACIVVVISIAIGGYFLWSNLMPDEITYNPSGEVEVPEKGLSELAIVNTVTIKENASGANRIIDVKYPIIQSFKNKDFQNYVNSNITSVILAYKDEIMAIIDEETPQTALYTYKTSYEKFAHGDYLSLVIANDYQTGGIRSNVWKDIYNINVRTERIFYLSDLFSSTVDYEREILREIKLQSDAQNYELMNGAGLNELDEKQKFFIKDDKLIIYFDPSEIAPTSYGELQFVMPFTLGEDGLFNP